MPRRAPKPPNRSRERAVLIACRGSKTLRARILTLARDDGRSLSDYVRRLLEDEVTARLAKRREPPREDRENAA